MKRLLPLLILAALPALSQQRFLVSSRGDAIPLAKGQSPLSVAKEVGLFPEGAGCTGLATFGYPPALYPSTTNHIGFHNDIVAEWFMPPANGTLDSVFWFQSANVCAPDSQLVLRLFKSNVYPGHGPGYGGYPAASSSTCWGYWESSADLEDGVAAFPEDATGPWTSTVVGGPGPSYPPVDSSIWGLSGFPVKAKANSVNSVYMDPSLATGGTVTLHQGVPFFMTLKITGDVNDNCCGTCGTNQNTGFFASADTDHVHSHNWKFYENVVTFQAGFTCKGWVARGDFNINFWYVMTATSNLPPTISNFDKINNTISTAPQTISAEIFDCDPADAGKAGVESAGIRYRVTDLAGNLLASGSASLGNIGGDTYLGTLPGTGSKNRIVHYRVFAVDSLGSADSTLEYTYKVVDFNSTYYLCDTTLACTPMSIVGTGTVIDTSKWFLPPGTTNVARGDDGTAGPYSLGGPFVYFGDTLNYAWVGVNGAIALSRNATDTLDVNSNGFATDGFDLPQRQHQGRPDTARRAAGFMPKNFIAPYWADWISKQDSPFATYGHVRTSSTAYPGKFVVEWDSSGDFDATGAIGDNDIFRVILDRGTGTIQFQYPNIGIGGLDAANLTGINSDSLKHPPGPIAPFNYFNKDGYPPESHLHNGLCVTYNPVLFCTAGTDGWNLVCLGSFSPSNQKSFIFPTATSPSAFYYGGSYVPTQTIVPGRGYWVKFSGAQNQCYVGSAITCVDDTLLAGWNIIGCVSQPVLVGSLTTTPPSIVTSPCFGFSGSYTVATIINPGRGYWVKTNAAGIMHLCSTSGAIAKQSPGISELSGLDRVTIQEVKGRSQTLYIGSDAILSAEAAHKYELPPSAPEKALNVRFASGRMVEVYPSQPDHANLNEYTITMDDAVYPLSLSWESQPGEHQKLAIMATTPKERQLLGIINGTGKVTISDPNVTKLVLKLVDGLAVPKEFALSQNYPNPFNPTTQFSVDVPKAAAVNITVYDVLGRKIATLMNGEQAAGYHVTEWDSRDEHGLTVPSGMYMVRMTAGDFSQVRKILLMK